MASVSREVNQQHRSLMIKLCNMMYPNDPTYKNFIYYLESHIPRGMLDREQQNPTDVFRLMEKRGILKAGEYHILKEALKASGYINVLDMLENGEKDIARQMRKRSYNDGPMACGSSNIDAATVSSIKPEEPATVSSIKPEEMPQGMDGKICIIKCYADLKLELERDIGMDIAKGLFKKERHKDVLEDLHQAGTRRLCIDRLLKRVLKLEASDLKIFFDLLKRHCRERAKKLAEIKVTDKDRENFAQVSESVKMAPHRIQNGLKFDVEFFKHYFQDIPEKVDKIADVLLSQFYISIFDHSQLIKVNDPEKKIHALLEKIQSCRFDSDLEVKSLLGSKLYQKWQCFKVDGSRQGLENQGIWHYVQERIQSSKEYLIELFRGLGIYFMQARRGSLVLKFVTLDNFDVKLLTPEAVKTKVLDMIKTLCPEYQDVFKEPVHLTIFFKPLSNTDSAEIHFYLETSKEKEEFSCMKLGSHDKQYFLEEMNSASLTNWMFNTLQLDEDTKTKLVDLVSREDMPRRKKMKILLNIVESLGNGYELLEKYCEEHDTFLYDEVFKKHRQVNVEENPDLVQQYEFSEEGLQKLSSTWIDFTVDSKDAEDDGKRTINIEYDRANKKGLLLILNFTEERKGTHLDVSALKKFFEDKLKFDVEDPRQDKDHDLTLSELDKALEHTKSLLNLQAKTYYCFFCAVLSHENEKGIRCSDGQFKNVDDIMKTFTNDKISNFGGKPRVFLIQACRDEAIQQDHPIANDWPTAISDVTGKITVPTEADVLVAYAMTPGNQAWRYENIGSWFIHVTKSVFETCHDNEHVEEMFMRVKDEIAHDEKWKPKTGQRMIPCIWSTLRKKLMI